MADLIDRQLEESWDRVTLGGERPVELRGILHDERKRQARSWSATPPRYRRPA